MLPPHYYLHNFSTLIRFVSVQYADLLTPEESDWALAFEALPLPARCLYVRLLSRTGSSFRLSKLHYPEIEPLPPAVTALAAAGLVSIAPPTAVDELLDAFTLPELRRHCPALCGRAGTRAQVLARILSASDPAVHDRHAEFDASCQRLRAADSWIRLTGRAEFELFLLCFFGNHHQDLSEFVRRDLGTLRYVPYRLDGSARAFADRPQLEAHRQLMLCERACEALEEADVQSLLVVAGGLPAATRSDTHLQRRTDRLRNRLARQLERLGSLEEALTLYTLSERSPAAERAVRVLAALGREQEALQRCQQLAARPRDDTEAQFCEHFLPRLQRRCGHRETPMRPYRPRTTRLVLREQTRRVEQASVRYYSRFGTCHHVENSLVCGVLGLFIWDIVFQPLPGAFFNPFQAAPADFHAATFCRARADTLSARFGELDDPPRFVARVQRNYAEQHGLVNPLVHWSRLSESLIEKALARIPAHHWRALFDRLLADLRHHGSGLPDLVLFPHAGGYEFIEIKGPGDALQKNQRRWMEYLAVHGVPCRVVQVRWALAETVG